MNLNFKKIIAAVSALTLVCGMTSVQPLSDSISKWTVNASAEDDYNIVEGSCGENASYHFDRITGELKIWGTGAIIEGSFSGKYDITNVSIERGITEIGDKAFNCCDGIRAINLPDSVEKIGEYAFYGCYNLPLIGIPENVTSIGTFAFGGCIALGSVVFSGNSKLENIGDHAFYLCKSLSSIDLPESLKVIEEEAFCDCRSLNGVTIPKNVESIGKDPFALDISIKEFNVSKDNQYYSSVDGVLFNKDQTLLIKYPLGNTRTQYIVPDTVVTIGNNSFYDSNLGEVVLPDSVIKIEGDAFGYSRLQSIAFSNSVKNIDNSAFSGCQYLQTVYYNGTKSDWENIQIGYGNEDLIAAIRLYNNSKLISGASLALDGSLKVNIKFNADIAEADGYTINGEAFSTTDKTISYAVPAKDFMHPIVIMKGDVAIAEFSVSSLLSQYKAMEDTKEIAAAIEDYCIAAKAYFANEKVENYSNYYANIKKEIGAHSVDMGKDYYGMSLLLKSGTILRHYYTSKVEGSVEKNGYYYIDEEVPAYFYSNEDKYCVNDYIYKVLASEETDSNLKNLCAALYNYGKAAKNYAMRGEK